MTGTQSTAPSLVAEFLKQCTDSTKTYDAFKRLLLTLDEAVKPNDCAAPVRSSFDALANHGEKSTCSLRRYFSDTRALEQLTALCEWSIAQTDQHALRKQYHFSFNEIVLAQGSIYLLQLPSIFQPEDWSFTFYEGLSRYRRSDYQDKTVVELGCGNGWISIALALCCALKRIYGLDINPRAITCARLNVYLNARLSTVATKVGDQQDRLPLWQRVQFDTSDLLATLRDQQLQADWIIGCIPQVLAPDPGALKVAVTEYDTDNALHDLSNYTAPQGYLEDQFGLGLIARAIDESIACLKPQGKIILNMGGRPGQHVLAQLFLRRGLLIRPIWSTLVAQAADTEIDALVQIEQNSDHRFEFYMTAEASQPICAQTAREFSKSGGDLYHALTVIEAWLPQQEAVLDILNFLKAPGRRAVYESLDLSAQDQEQFSERVNFLAKLAKNLEGMAHLPYGPTAGRLSLRRGISLFLNNYFKCALSPDHIMIAPSRSDLFANILLTFKSRRTLFDQRLLNALDAGRVLARLGAGSIIETPTQHDLLCRLIDTLDPDLVITSLDDLANSTVQLIAQLVDAAKSAQARLIIDISAYFDLSSQPNKCAALSYIAIHGLPEHVCLVCGLIKNRVYRDLYLCFMISNDHTFLQYLWCSAELTYSRTPFFAQFYYETLLAELLSFQLLSARGFEKESHTPKQGEDHLSATLKASALDAFEHPAISARLLLAPIWAPSKVQVTARGKAQSGHAPTLLRLDYGENQLPVSETVKAACFTAFSASPLSAEAEQAALKGVVRRWYRQRCGVEHFSQAQIHFGAGVAPLFAQTLLAIKASGQTIIFPQGCYGEFYAAALFFGVNIAILETESVKGYHVNPKTLGALLKQHPGAWVYLNVPYSNPTGLCYRHTALHDLFSVVRASAGRVLIDTIYDGLSLADDLDHRPEALLPPADLEGIECVIYMGLSKLMACGGLRFGAALSTCVQVNEALAQNIYRSPHHTVLTAARILLEAYLKQDAVLVAALNQQQKFLVDRAKRLCDCLSACGWVPVRPEGGLFLIAKPHAYLGAKIPMEKVSVAVAGALVGSHFDCAGVVTLLSAQTGLVINGDDWTGIKDHCRFVLSVSEAVFTSALQALEQFHAVFAPQNT